MNKRISSSPIAMNNKALITAAILVILGAALLAARAPVQRTVPNDPFSSIS